MSKVSAQHRKIGDKNLRWRRHLWDMQGCLFVIVSLNILIILKVFYFFFSIFKYFVFHCRVLSAPLNYADYMRHPMFGDFDFLFGEDEPDPDGRVYVSFQDERVSEEQTETDVKNMEGRLKMSLQQLKEQVLGKVAADCTPSTICFTCF